MGWFVRKVRYLSNALTVNKSLVLISKKKTSRETDRTRPDQTGPERYVSVTCMCMNGMNGMK